MKKTVIYFTAAFSFVAVMVGYLSSEQADLVKAVQDREKVLTCLMHDGERAIDGDMVTGIIEGVWQFKNGQAKSCEVTEK